MLVLVVHNEALRTLTLNAAAQLGVAPIVTDAATAGATLRAARRAAEVDLGLRLVALPEGPYDGAETEAVMRHPVASRQRDDRPVARRAHVNDTTREGVRP